MIDVLIEKGKSKIEYYTNNKQELVDEKINNIRNRIEELESF
jgi:hypothetical protein